MSIEGDPVPASVECTPETAFSTYFFGAPKQSNESMNFTCSQEDGETRAVEFTRPIGVS